MKNKSTSFFEIFNSKNNISEAREDFFKISTNSQNNISEALD